MRRTSMSVFQYMRAIHGGWRTVNVVKQHMGKNHDESGADWAAKLNVRCPFVMVHLGRRRRVRDGRSRRSNHRRRSIGDGRLGRAASAGRGACGARRRCSLGARRGGAGLAPGRGGAPAGTHVRGKGVRTHVGSNSWSTRYRHPLTLVFEIPAQMGFEKARTPHRGSTPDRVPTLLCPPLYPAINSDLTSDNNRCIEVTYSFR